MKLTWNGSAAWLLLCLLLPLTAGAPPGGSGPGILIGVEYVFPGGGRTFGGLQVPLAKPYGEFHEWLDFGLFCKEIGGQERFG